MKKITSLLMMFMLFVGMGWAQSLAVETTTDGKKVYYTIQNVNCKKYATCTGALVGEVLLSNDAASAGAYWYFDKAATDGKVKIKNNAMPDVFMMNQCYDGLFNLSGNEWRIQQNEDGAYTISVDDKTAWNNHGGVRLTPYGITDVNSKWNLVKVTDNSMVPTSNSFVKNAASVKLSDNGYRFFYEIINSRAGKYAAAGNDANAQLVLNNANAKKLWYFEDAGDGNVIIRNASMDGAVAKPDANGTFTQEGKAFKLADASVGGSLITITDPTVTGDCGDGSGPNASWNNFQGKHEVISTWGANDLGSRWYFRCVTLDEPQMHEASENVEANGIKYSSLSGTKYFYTIESLRQNSGFRYAYVADNKLKRGVTPDGDINKWFFVKGKTANSVVLVNAGVNQFLNAKDGGMSSSSYKEFYLVNATNSGYKCITEDANNIADGSHCLDASQDNAGLSGGWNDLDEATAGTAWKISEVAPYDVNFRRIVGENVKGTTKTHIATFSYPLHVTIPQGVEAYTINEEPNATAQLVKYNETVLPANTGVVLLGEADHYTFEPVFKAVSSVSGNLLKNSANHKTVSMVGGDYILTTPVALNSTQFYKAKPGSILSVNKAYLHLNTAQTSKFSLNFGDEVTGVESLEVEENVNAPIYDLSGRRVLSTAKGGIYIQNGKKFIVK